MNKLIISAGASKLFKNREKEIAVEYLKDFKDFIEELRENYSLAVITGGGDIAREYIKAAKALDFNEDQQDELAIGCTRVNAKLLKFLILGGNKVRETIEKMKVEFLEKGITIAGGTKPGHTTDKVSTLLASELDCKRILNLTDVRGVYTKDPGKFEDAELIKEMSWEEFFNILGKIEHSPGLNMPFEPQAGKVCQKEGIEVGVTSSLEEARNYIQKKSFKGTLIK